MEYTNRIETINLDELSDFERVDQQLRTLLVSAAGTIPGSRGFGLSGEFLSGMPPEDAISDFAEELDEKCEQYLPEVTISGVDMEPECDGEIGLTLYVEGREDDD